MLELPYFFFLLRFLVFFSSLMTVSTRNPVHSVLFLILTFINSSFIILLMGSEFLALVILIVYVGAVAVLFLFVVMMLDIKLLEQRRDFLLYFPVSTLLVYSFSIFFSFGFTSSSIFFPYADFVFILFQKSLNSNSLGDLLYVYYFPNFILSGFILLVAMVGSISLTLSSIHYSKRQIVSEQVFRFSSLSNRVKLAKFIIFF